MATRIAEVNCQLLVPLLLAIDLEDNEVELEESEYALEYSGVVAAGPEVSVAGI